MTREIPVLHVSGTFVDIEDKIQGLESGADGYLTSVAEPLELVATVRSLLRARRAEDAAQLSARQWQTTFDTISDGVMLFDGEGKVVQVNRTLERLLSRPWNELVGKDIPSLLGDPEESARHALRPDARVAASLDPGRGDGRTLAPRQRRPDPRRGSRHQGGTLPRHRHHQPETAGDAAPGPGPAPPGGRSPQGRVPRDARPRAPQSPVPPVACAGDHRLAGRPPDLAAEALDVARRQVQHMSRLVEDLLDLSRITRGRIELRKQAVDFNQIVAQAIEASRPLMESRGHEFERLCVPSPCGSRATRPAWSRSSRIC